LPGQCSKDLEQLGKQLQQELFQITGFELAIKTGRPAKADIYLALSPEEARYGQEGYRFEVGEVLKISSAANTGLFWGTRTLLQLMESERAIPKGIAIDYPSYKVRGLVLDAGRKFFSIEFLRQYVKLLSYYKMNDFQIHLNDNGFKKYFSDNWD